MSCILCFGVLGWQRQLRKPLLLKCEECWPGFGSVPEVERFTWIMNNEGIISFVAKTIFRMFTLKRTLV